MRRGAAVTAFARSRDQLAATVDRADAGGGGSMRATAGDVRDVADVARAVSLTQEAYGRIDLLVNNAGVAGPIGPMWEADIEQWCDTIAVNLLGPVQFIAAVMPVMVAAGAGRVVNVSGGGATGPFPHGAAYGVSKTAITRLTENLAAEAAEHGVNAFAVSPGLVKTALTSMVEPGWREWMPRIAQMLESGQDIPATHAAELVAAIAAGELDALSGRMVSVIDDLDQLKTRTADIEAQQLYLLRLQRLAE